jgi:hypothetical protein
MTPEELEYALSQGWDPEENEEIIAERDQLQDMDPTGGAI